MSSSAAVVFYGIRFDLAQEEIEALESRTDPRLASARRNGLKHYWGNFGAPGEKWLLFIGEKVGVLGPEGQDEVQLSRQHAVQMFADTEVKLRQAGFTEEPKLHVQWHPDA